MIQMKRGTFGLPVKGGVVKAMSKDSGPFEAGKEQEARLVKLGLAVYVDGGTTALPEDVTGIPEYSVDNTVAELREIGKLCGLTFKVGMTKAEMVAALDAHIEEHTEDEEPEETDDDAEEDGEPAPTFDATEAVL